MLQRIVVVAIDLGTSTTTASYVIVRHSFDAEGNSHREKCGSVHDVRDWPGGDRGEAIGKVCVPTDLVYNKASRQLHLWGFEAQHYLDDPLFKVQSDRDYVVEHIKLLLPDPDEAKVPNVASARYRVLRESLTEALGKHPYEVFEDFMTQIVGHIMGSANRRYGSGIYSCRVELILAFPSGWRDHIHTTVARIGARAMEKAISMNHLENMVFGIENVYTVSETLCGVKEWLRDTIAEATTSIDLNQNTTNLDELNEGDCFLPVDIGGGTGCMTPLRLVTKTPLRVDQLGPTQCMCTSMFWSSCADLLKALEVSGEAVDAEFEHWLRPRVTKKDCPGDVAQCLYHVCRKFKERKKDCGHPTRHGFSTWNVPVHNLRANQSKGFGKGCMKIDLKYIDRCFDPVIKTLESAIKQMLHKIPDIKAIVFLGQFGGRSEYLRKRMAESDISSRVKLRHNSSGKLSVVKGAMSERLSVSSSFVRKCETLRSYGALVALPYYPGSDAANYFPNPSQDGAVPFERQIDGLWLKLICWAIPKGTIVERGHTCDVGKDGPRHHTWSFHEKFIEFEDIIIVSDEVPPPPQYDGKSYTLWTEAHEQNRLVINNQIMHVHQIPFSWNLTMSQKINSAGNVVGPYEIEDLETYKFPEIKRKGKRRVALRRMYYDLVWDITEMQVKVHVRALFPNQIGPRTTQLAKERQLDVHERVFVGESRSKALTKDIEIATAADLWAGVDGVDASENDVRREFLTDIRRSAEPQLSDDPTREYQQSDRTESPRMTSPTRIRPQFEFHSINDSISKLSRNKSRPAEASSSNTFRSDGRRRDGCDTCKYRKKKCGSLYTFDEARGSRSCNECIRHGIYCHVTQPEQARDPLQVTAQQLERGRLVTLGKRKAREESDSSSTVARDRSATTYPSNLSMH